MLRNRFSMVMMRTVLELRGMPRIPMEGEHEIKDQLIFSSSFPEDNDTITLYLNDREGTGHAELLFLAINDLVEQLISKPKKYQDSFEMVPDGFKEGIDREAAKRRTMQSDLVA